MVTQQVLIYAHATVEAEALTDRLREAGWDALMSAVVREQHAQVTVIASQSEWIDVTVGSTYHYVCGQGDGRGHFDYRPTTLDGILSAMSRWEDSLTGEDDEAVESWDGSIHAPKPPSRTVETAEEDEVLPVGTVVRDAEGTIAEAYLRAAPGHGRREARSSTGGSESLPEDIRLPARILFEPEKD